MNSENDGANSTTTGVSSRVCTAPGALQTIIDNEIAAGLARLQVSREELLAEADVYPWVAENPDIYDSMLTSIVARARAVELLQFLIVDGDSTAVEDLDFAIAELRDVLTLAAPKPPSPAVARQLKEAAEEAAKEEEAA
jgi:dsDNA-binding SOS-regulon protein